MKKLANIIFGLALSSIPLFAQDELDFKKRDPLFEEKVLINQPRAPSYYEIEFFYDCNEGPYSCYSELYLAKTDSLGKVSLPKFPQYYFFYIEKDGKLEVKKKVIDVMGDGLNFNEKIYIYFEESEKYERSRTGIEL